MRARAATLAVSLARRPAVGSAILWALVALPLIAPSLGLA
jgi:hypothetical protein